MLLEKCKYKQQKQHQQKNYTDEELRSVSDNDE